MPQGPILNRPPDLEGRLQVAQIGAGQPTVFVEALAQRVLVDRECGGAARDVGVLGEEGTNRVDKKVAAGHGQYRSHVAGVQRLAELVLLDDGHANPEVGLVDDAGATEASRHGEQPGGFRPGMGDGAEVGRPAHCRHALQLGQRGANGHDARDVAVDRPGERDRPRP